MTDKHIQTSSTGNQFGSNNLYKAEVSQDSALSTTTLSLSSTDPQNSLRNIRESFNRTKHIVELYATP